MCQLLTASSPWHVPVAQLQGHLGVRVAPHALSRQHRTLRGRRVWCARARELAGVRGGGGGGGWAYAREIAGLRGRRGSGPGDRWQNTAHLISSVLPPPCFAHQTPRRAPSRCIWRCSTSARAACMGYCAHSGCAAAPRSGSAALLAAETCQGPSLHFLPWHCANCLYPSTD